jgi:exportin-T
VRDLLEPKVEIPEPEAGEESQDLLAEALATQGFFDAQLYLFETVGLLISLFHREPVQQSALLLSVAEPLLDRLQSALGAVKSAQDVLPILTVHHVMMALGNVAKGFPEYPSPIPEGHAPPPAEFQRVASAILVSLEAMNGFRAVRDAVRRILWLQELLSLTFYVGTVCFCAYSCDYRSCKRVFDPAADGQSARAFRTFRTRRLYELHRTFNPQAPGELAISLTNLFATFLADFVFCIAQQDFVDVLDQLVGPLNTHIAALLAQPVTGTDDQLTHADTKKSYLALLNGIMAAKLHGVFLSDRQCSSPYIIFIQLTLVMDLGNKDAFETLLTSMKQVAEDPSDPASQKAAFVFLGRCVFVWGVLPSADGATGGLPGFERFIYERLVPSAFRVIALPQFNIKDGQILVVCPNICPMYESS